MYGLSPPQIKNLHDEVGTGDFREDLLYRINVITLSVPSLRERPGRYSYAGRLLFEKPRASRELKMMEPKLSNFF